MVTTQPLWMVLITTVGNPDRNQYAPITVPHRIYYAGNRSELIATVRKYQAEEMIGSGNWTNPTVYLDNEPVGTMSYNCRIWNSRDEEV